MYYTQSGISIIPFLLADCFGFNFYKSFTTARRDRKASDVAQTSDLFLPSALFSSHMQPYLPRLVQDIVAHPNEPKSFDTQQSRTTCGLSLPLQDVVSGKPQAWRSKKNIKLTIGLFRVLSLKCEWVLNFNRLYIIHYIILNIHENQCLKIFIFIQ